MEDSAEKGYKPESFSKWKCAKCFRGKDPLIHGISCSERPRKAKPEVWALELVVMGLKCLFMTEDRSGMHRIFQDKKESVDGK